MSKSIIEKRPIISRLSELINSRSLWLGQMGLCFATLAASLYFEFVTKRIPCPLCLLERYLIACAFMVLCFGWVLIAKNHHPRKTQWVALGLYGLGVCVASRHVGLQLFAKPKTTCIFNFNEASQFFITKIFNALLNHSSSCGVIEMKLFGLSLAGWCLCLLIGLVALGILSLSFNQSQLVQQSSSESKESTDDLR